MAGRKRIIVTTVVSVGVLGSAVWLALPRAEASPWCCGGIVGCPAGVCCGDIYQKQGCTGTSCEASDCTVHRNPLTMFYGLSDCEGCCVGTSGYHMTCIVRECDSSCTAGAETQITKPTPVCVGPCPFELH